MQALVGHLKQSIWNEIKAVGQGMEMCLKVAFIPQATYQVPLEYSSVDFDQSVQTSGLRS